MLTLHTAESVRLTPDGEPLRHGAVLVSADRIAAVGALDELTAAHPGARLRRWPGELAPGRVHDGPLPTADTPRERVHAVLLVGCTAVVGQHLDAALRAAVDRNGLAVLAPGAGPAPLIPGARADLAVFDEADHCLATVLAGRLVHRRA
ncbi:hypothetical protein AQ490_13045 [Wenjunlia vitaminophila]|uniref:Aminodeoxyfutalosine deaminase/Imidazolonepropionase-like composite domain-containing protein n=1 Tax=Wenjunlia vitaminophila TaxID=76728 RepID=A0A0T6LXM8_WENVI|nr:hypothetical protein [Wenjunlia vitaminophila]KRV50875.1 hypothetical protein AQ490_13045 [Wenjunlia vitaminophila]